MENFIAEIRAFPYTRIPRGWKKCEGQTLAIVQFQAFFSLIGTHFGGDGTTNFKLPDLRGRTIVGAGIYDGMTYVNGTAGGVEAVTLTESQLGAHRHNVTAVNSDADQYIGAGYILGKTTVPLYRNDSGGSDVITIAPSTIEATGGGQPHGNVQPSSVCIFCIATEGYYPTWE